METGTYSIAIHEGDKVDAKAIYVLVNKRYHNCKEWLQKNVQADKIVQQFRGKRMSIIEGKTKRLFRTTLIKPDEEMATMVEWLEDNALEDTTINSLFKLKEQFGTTLGRAKLALALESNNK